MNLRWKITGSILTNINILKLFCTTDHFVWTCHLVALRIFIRRWWSSYLASCLSIVTSYLSSVLFGVCNKVKHKRTQFRVNEGGTKNPKAMWHFSSIHSMHVSSVDTLWSVVVVFFFEFFSINAFHFIYFYRFFCSLHSWCELLPYPLQIFRLNDQRCNFFLASFSLRLVVDISHFVCLNVVSSHRTAVGWLKWMFFVANRFVFFTRCLSFHPIFIGIFAVFVSFIFRFLKTRATITFIARDFALLAFPLHFERKKKNRQRRERDEERSESTGFYRWID